MKFGTTALVALCGLVGACGGNSGGINSMPTPTPVATYVPPIPNLPISLERSVSSAQIPVALRWSGETVTFGTIEQNVGFAHSINVFYQGDGKYTVQFYVSEKMAESIPYENSTIQSGFDVFQKSATNRVPETVGYASSLTLFRGVDSSLRMQYLSYGIWEQHQVDGADREGLRKWFVFGQVTPYNIQPTTGSAVYNGIVDAELIADGKITRLGGSGSFAYDFADNTKSGTIFLDQPDGAGGRKPFDSFTFTRASNGILTSANGMQVFPYGVIFGGPHAEEAAMPFIMQGSGLVTGIFVGKQ